jgi:hypothetical protein
MDPEIKELSMRLHELYEQIMEANPWDDGYGEVVSIHEYLMKVLRDKAQKDYADFQKYLTEAAKDIEETWSSNRTQISKWSSKLRPVFETVETIISHAVPLLALL